MPNSSSCRNHPLLRAVETKGSIRSASAVTGLHRHAAPADRLHACFREAEVLDLALLNQLFHRAGDLFDRHVRINAVLVEEVDGLDLQPLERALDSLLDMPRLTIQPRRGLRAIVWPAEVEAEPWSR